MIYAIGQLVFGLSTTTGDNRNEDAMLCSSSKRKAVDNRISVDVRNLSKNNDEKNDCGGCRDSFRRETAVLGAYEMAVGIASVTNTVRISIF